MEPPVPNNEWERLSSLRALNLLDAPAEDRFCRLTRLACKLFDAPVSMLTFVDAKRQWFKSTQGHLLTESPRSESFCQYTIEYGGPMVVEDATLDPRFAGIPAVAEMGIKFYAGVPVFSDERQAIGTLCVLDDHVRTPDAGNMEALLDLARCVQSELRIVGYQEIERKMLSEMDELRRKACIDPVTRCWNVAAGMELLAELRGKTKLDSRSALAVVLVSLEKLQAVNRTYGNEAGDYYLRETSNLIRRMLPDEACLARSQAANFMVVYPTLAAEKFREVGSALVDDLNGRQIRLVSRQVVPLEVCAGMAVCSHVGTTAEELVEKALQALYRAKEEGPGTFRQSI